VRIRSAIFAVALIGLLAVPGRADVVLFDQSPTSGQPTNGNQFSITSDRLADDFTLANVSTVNSLLFYYTAQNPSDLASVSYAIYTNSAGTLGTVLASGTTSVITRTGQGTNQCGNCSSAAFSITPVPLSGGTYWLELHNGTSLTDTSELEVDWAAVDDNTTLIAQTDYGSGMKPNMPVGVPGYNQYAFQVIGTTVPEPGTLVLLALGLSILIVKARRAAAR
jgi:hypothetical protein